MKVIYVPRHKNVQNAMGFKKEEVRTSLMAQG